MGNGVEVARAGNLPFLTSVRTRRVEPELMDDPNLDPKLLAQALAGLRRINALSMTARVLWRPIYGLARELSRPIRVLDLATGGGDSVLGLSRLAERRRVAVEVDGCDVNLESVAYASRRARDEGVSARFFELDVASSPIPPGYDVIVSSLFMHHLDDRAAEDVLRAIRAAGPRLVIVSDLVRSAAGFLVAQGACRILTRSHVVHYDGPRSVAAAFTMPEFAALADRAGLGGHRIVWSWPFRFLFTWKPT